MICGAKTLYLFVQCTMWVTSFALAVKWCTWNGIHISQWERLTTILIYFVTTGEKKLSHVTAEYLNALQLSPHNCMYLVWFISFEISVLWSIVFFRMIVKVMLCSGSKMCVDAFFLFQQFKFIFFSFIRPFMTVCKTWTMDMDMCSGFSEMNSVLSEKFFD